MRIARTVDGLRELVNQARQGADKAAADCAIGFVPTMGYLHEGHASLLQRARDECRVTVLSIFVNPLQFGANEDLSRYPRSEERDLQIAEQCGVDIVFLPQVKDMYPQETRTKVSVSGVSDLLCGASRPGHFDGVATVVTKLLNMVQPDRAYFGMKDAQQVAVVERMVSDLNIPVEIVPCPIIREPDGLALSSRNVYLTEDQRQHALILSRTLQMTADWLAQCGGDLQAVREKMVSQISSSPLAVIDYIELMLYPDIIPAYKLPLDERDNKQLLAAVAVTFGKTRLIDNQLFELNTFIDNWKISNKGGNLTCSEP